MTVLSPFEALRLEEAKTKYAKPREFIDVWMVGVKDLRQLAELRVHHPGGAPKMDPASWTGAFEDGRLVAAVGWTIFEPGIVTMLEIDKTGDRWGTIGAVVLIRSFVEGARAKGLRIQAWVMPGNDKLKAFIAKNINGAKVILEIFEAPQENA